MRLPNSNNYSITNSGIVISCVFEPSCIFEVQKATVPLKSCWISHPWGQSQGALGTEREDGTRVVTPFLLFFLILFVSLSANGSYTLHRTGIFQAPLHYPLAGHSVLVRNQSISPEWAHLTITLMNTAWDAWLLNRLMVAAEWIV